MSTLFDGFRDYDGNLTFLSDEDLSKVPYNELAERADTLYLAMSKHDAEVTARLELIIRMLDLPYDIDGDMINDFCGGKEIADMRLTVSQCRAIAEFLKKEVLDYDRAIKKEAWEYVFNLLNPELLKRYPHSPPGVIYDPIDTMYRFFDKRKEEEE